MHIKLLPNLIEIIQTLIPLEVTGAILILNQKAIIEALPIDLQITIRVIQPQDLTTQTEALQEGQITEVQNQEENNMKKYLLILTTVTLSTFITQAQNEIDALRYSQDIPLGNARFSAMGGAFGALGGNLSSLSYNPAGIGMYQFTELSITPSFSLNNNTSYFASNKASDFKGNLNIKSLGLVLSNIKDDSDWKRINYAIGWNQLADYNYNTIIRGWNNTTSMADNILAKAQGNKIDDLNIFHAGPAFWTDLIDLANNSVDTTITPNWYTHDNGSYISHINGSTNKLQSKYHQSAGGKNEFFLAFGGSYKEQLYVGATIGMPTLEYYEKSSYKESNFEDTINGLNAFNYEEELQSNGNGINLKIGAILRLSETFKVGASIHSPTSYTIEESYNSSITTHFTDQTYKENSPINSFEYQLITPWKAILSASTVIEKKILVSADYEIVDYSFTRMHSTNYDFEEENTTISNLYTKTNNIRLGAEINTEPFILRAGYTKYGSAFANKDLGSENYSFGIGINNGTYYFDAAYVLSQGKSEHLLYNQTFVNPVTIESTNHNLVFTLGFRY